MIQLPTAQSVQFGRTARRDEIPKLKEMVRQHFGDTAAEELQPQLTFVTTQTPSWGDQTRDMVTMGRRLAKLPPDQQTNVVVYQLMHYADEETADTIQNRLEKLKTPEQLLTAMANMALDRLRHAPFLDKAAYMRNPQTTHAAVLDSALALNTEVKKVDPTSLLFRKSIPNSAFDQFV